MTSAAMPIRPQETDDQALAQALPPLRLFAVRVPTDEQDDGPSRAVRTIVVTAQVCNPSEGTLQFMVYRILPGVGLLNQTVRAFAPGEWIDVEETGQVPNSVLSLVH